MVQAVCPFWDRETPAQSQGFSLASRCLCGATKTTEVWHKICMIWVPLLNAQFTTGDFVAAEQEDGNVCSVCQVINVLHPDVMRVTLWLRTEQLSALQLQELPPVDASFKNLRKCRLKEVTERLLAINTIKTCQVRGLVFGFHATTLEHDILNCAGMKSVFFTRF
jgi:hypothetical protein